MASPRQRRVHIVTAGQARRLRPIYITATSAPRTEAAAAILTSNVARFAPTRCAIAILIASGVRAVRSSRRKGGFRAPYIDSKGFDMPRRPSGQASRTPKAFFASAMAISPVRTRRAIADANSARAKSLKNTNGLVVRKNVPARGVKTSLLKSEIRTLVSKYTLIVLLHPACRSRVCRRRFEPRALQRDVHQANRDQDHLPRDVAK